MDNENKIVIQPFDINDATILDTIEQMRITENNKVDYMGLCIYLSKLEYNQLPFLIKFNEVKVIANDLENSKLVVKIDNKITKILNILDNKCKELLKNIIIINNDNITDNDDPFCISYMDSVEDSKQFDVIYNNKTSILCKDIEMAPADVKIGDKISVILMIDSIIFLLNTREARTKYTTVLVDILSKKPRPSTKPNPFEEFLNELITKHTNELIENSNQDDQDDQDDHDDQDKIVDTSDKKKNSKSKNLKEPKIKKEAKTKVIKESKTEIQTSKPIRKSKINKVDQVNKVDQDDQVIKTKKPRGKKSTEPVESVEPVKPVEPVEPVEPVKPVKTNKSNKSKSNI